MPAGATLAGLARMLLGLAPVCLFLAGLVFLDSYKLVRPRRVLLLLGAGILAALLSLVVNQELAARLNLDGRTLARFLAPAVEESLKGLPLLLLLKRRRIGFLVDAAICGFALGAGFALAENLYYFQALPDSTVALWVVRGFGTAVMHGGTTAILGMVAKTLIEHSDREPAWRALPALLLAVAIHAGFNQFFFPPLVSAVVVIATLPPALLFTFERSERRLRSWLGSGFDLDAELIGAIRGGRFAETPTGLYLQSLAKHFQGPVLADMLCYIRLFAELSMRAKGVLMLRENGLPVPQDPQMPEKLAEFDYLRRSIGRTGQLALAPILQASAEDIWQLRLLGGE